MLRFFPTGPSTFYMYFLTERPNTPDEFKKAYVRNLRIKVIRKENVLAVSKDILHDQIYDEFAELDERDFPFLFDHHCRFMDRWLAETDVSVQQLMTFILVVSSTKMLIYRVATFLSRSDEPKVQSSIGFGRHIDDDDFAFFHNGYAALKANAARELREELFFDRIYYSYRSTLNMTRVVRYSNVGDNFDAQHHITVLMEFCYKSDEPPRRNFR